MNYCSYKKLLRLEKTFDRIYRINRKNHGDGGLDMKILLREMKNAAVEGGATVEMKNAAVEMKNAAVGR